MSAAGALPLIRIAASNTIPSGPGILPRLVQRRHPHRFAAPPSAIVQHDVVSQDDCQSSSTFLATLCCNVQSCCRSMILAGNGSSGRFVLTGSATVACGNYNISKTLTLDVTFSAPLRIQPTAALFTHQPCTVVHSVHSSLNSFMHKRICEQDNMTRLTRVTKSKLTLITLGIWPTPEPCARLHGRCNLRNLNFPLNLDFILLKRVLVRGSPHGCRPAAALIRRAHMLTLVRLLASHMGKLGSIPGGVAPIFSYVRIVPDDAAGRQVFSRISCFPSPFIPALFHTHLASTSSFSSQGFNPALGSVPLADNRAVVDNCHSSSTSCPKENAGDQQPASPLEQTPRKIFKTPGKPMKKGQPVRRVQTVDVDFVPTRQDTRPVLYTVQGQDAASQRDEREVSRHEATNGGGVRAVTSGVFPRTPDCNKL
ncbi:hypothetical protein PR048_000373 [Dryococelus australis]|uniref:Uncharacterized protein n=1 Tax=Dryococelus australis TaxID=614101 RepID=A0ABQ9IEE6_9NEOP|nr:hypothetical protein PR048_000373 [Dryococelus australis]